MFRKFKRDVRKFSKMVRKFSKMARKCSGIDQKISENGQEMVQDDQEMFKKCQLMSVNSMTLYKAVCQDGQRFRNNKRCLKHRKNTFWICKAWVPKPQRPAAKKETLEHPPHFYGSIFFLCSFLFSLFKSFQMSHGAISPSLMVLFFFYHYP